MPKPIPILLVEDDPQWQTAIQSLLEADTRFQLAATADCYETALTAFQQVQPKVVLLDWKIKGEQDGLAVGDSLQKAGIPPERIILISGSSPSSIPAHPFLYVPKTRLANELIPLIASVTIN
jgi:DNA-binding NarL/FixJ family response regulator